MHTLNCYLFEDGFKAYFFDNDRKHHIKVIPGEIMTISETMYSKFNLKKLKIKYSQWNKRWENK